MTFSRKIKTVFLTFACIGLVGLNINTTAANTRTDSLKVTLTEGTNIAIALSPDKKTIAMDLQGTIFTIPVSGSNAKALTDELGDCRQPVWSPDGSKITFQAFWDGNFHIYSVDKNGGAPVQLTFGTFDDREPYWSPDGKKLVFSSDRSGNYDIWQLEPESGKLTQLTHDQGNDYFPAFSPDGSRLSYVSERTSAPGIYMMETSLREASGKEKLFLTTTGKLGAPMWHPSKPKIIFHNFIEGKTVLDMATLGGGEWITLSEPDEDVFPFKVSWLSDTEYLYASDGKIVRKKLGEKQGSAVPFQVQMTLGRTPYKTKIYDFNAKTNRPVKGIRGPVVSPDGKSIAFTALGDLYILKKGSDIPFPITNDEFIEIDPAWSTDGKRLAYLSDRKGNMDLYCRDFVSGKDTLLLDAPDALTLPSFSADGTQIAYYQKDPSVFGRFAMKVIDIASGKSTNLYEPIFDGSQPSWSPDGKYVVVSSLVPYSTRYREGVSKFLIISTKDKSFRYTTPANERTLSTRGKNGPYWSPDGSKFAFSMDGVLWIVAVNEKGDLLAAPRRLTNELAENPSWTGDSKSIVFMATDVLKKVSVLSGATETIQMSLNYMVKQPIGKYVIHAGKLFNGKTDGYQRNVDVFIERNRIVKIEPHKAGRTGKLIDASTKTVIPGLIEMHTHQSATAGEQLGRLWLGYGITTTRETGGDPYDVIERKESWASGRRIGPRNFYTGGILDGSRIYYGMNVGNVAGAQLELELEKAKRLEFDMIKTYVRMPDVMQQRITSFAHSIGIPVSSHEIYPAMRYGVDAVEHIGATSRRGYSPKLSTMNKSYQDVTELLIKSGMNITPTASLQGGMSMLVNKDAAFFNHKQFAAFYSPAILDQVKEQTALRSKINPAFLTTFSNIQKTIKTMVDRGGHVTPGTDSPIIHPGISYHAELQSWVDGGVTPFQTLRSATLYAAEALGVSKDLGTLESGKLADMVIVDGDPLKNIKDVLNVQTVIRNGEVFAIEDILKNRN
ncbi:amidohydrolase family protein [Dyadobacter arcticus]|uniref:Tol biopolymer transport system component/imidazolonepropionase-like amidohydrolase n=1 Tax=Dyadobacter arcticus TaxID=1078754 RepID=A0ABX0UP73_9BACT|nr:amidohydrolase family protein [Dyadobacter arcticus]NIJ54742.1 Tol biopolymer transport system component/imidazolonepropionase-like amidohydrolase [Dyadobacter arcticus]